MLELETKLTLERNAAGLKIKTTIVNTAKDHRVRVLIPTGLVSDKHMADSPFEVVRRPKSPWKSVDQSERLRASAVFCCDGRFISRNISSKSWSV